MIILPSKLMTPELPDFIIERKRLLDFMNENQEDGSIILHAPAGYGKTVLAIQYISKYVGPGQSVWIDLDHYDNSPQRLIGYIMHGLAKVSPTVKNSRIINEVDSVEPGSIIDNLCLLFQEYIDSEYWLVLDNWETIDSKELGDIIIRLINHTNGRLKFIINSRVKPSFNTQKLAEANRLKIIDKEKLQLTFSEFIDAVNKRTDKSFDEEQLERFWKLTSGWCINLCNIVNFIEKGENVDQVISVDDYIGEELFRNLDERILEKILVYSTLEIISPESCRVLTDDKSEIELFLKKLPDLSIPIYALADRRRFRMHPLVRETARKYFFKKFDSEFVNETYRKVADYYLKENNIIQAIESLLAVDNHLQVLEILDTKWNDLVQMNLPRNVGQWLDAILTKYQNNPLFIKTKSNYLTLIGDNKRMLEYLSDKINFSDYPRGSETLSSLWINYSWALINSSDDPQYENVLKSFKMLIKNNGPFSDISMAIFENTLSVAAHLELNYRAALKHLNKCLDYLPSEYINNRVIGMHNLGLYYHQIGKSRDALEILDESFKLAKQHEVNTPLAGGTIIKASIYLSMGYFSRTIELVEECIERMKDNRLYNIGTQMYAERFKGEALWYLGEREEGIRLIANSLKASEYHNKVSIATTKYLLEFYRFHSGLPVEAIDPDKKDVCKHINEARPVYLTILAIKGIINNGNDSKKTLDDLSVLIKQKKLKPWQITESFLLAVYFYKRKQFPEARKHLNQGLNLIANLKWKSYPMACEYINTQIYFQAIKFDIKIKTAENLIAGEFRFDPIDTIKKILQEEQLDKNALTRLFKSLARLKIRGLIQLAQNNRNVTNPALKSSAAKYIKTIENQPLPPLTIYTLGRFELFVGGRKCQFKRKKSKQILQYLMLAPNQSVHEEQLIEQFWPESDPKKGKASLRTAIKDLRISLDKYYEPRNKSYIVYNNQHYKMNLPEKSFIDFQYFEKEMKKYHKKTSSVKLSDNKLNKYYRSLTLYKGQFLPEELYESYTIEFREYLKNLYQTSLLTYAEELIDKSRHLEIVKDLEMAVIDEPLWRDGVEILIRIYVRLEKPFAAIKLYKKYENDLFNDLGLAPDDKLKRSMQQIV